MLRPTRCPLSSDSPYVRETIENWVGDFMNSDALDDAVPGASRELREHAPTALTHLLFVACAESDRAPGELEQEELSVAFLEALAPQAFPEAVHRAMPDLVAGFLGFLEGEGRLGGGRALGATLRAMRERYRSLAGGKRPPVKNVATKLGRNDPCPCGSGKKYKKCCLAAGR
jgi:hypothetical protein